jgi:hypothetical protein
MSFQDPDEFAVIVGPPPRSFAVTVVAVVNYTCGVLNLLCGGFCIVFLFLVAPVFEDSGADSGILSVIGSGILGVTMIISLPQLIAGYGVGKRSQWGRTLTIVLGFISAVLAVVVPALLVLHAGYAVTVLVILFNSQYAAEFA